MGGIYEPRYVNCLYGGVSRNLSHQFRFLCFTDDSSGIRPEVEIYPIPNSISPDVLKKVMLGRKLELFQKGLEKLEGPCLFFDLDVIIVDSINCFFDFKPGEFCMCQEWLPPHQIFQYMLLMRTRGGNSSIFRFEADSMQFIVEAMNANTQLHHRFYTDQRLLSHFIRERINWWPTRWVKSFKHCKPLFPINYFLPPVIPSGARIMVFNGPLKPPHALSGNFELLPA